MSDHSADLATLIGSRICHDLISPIGAISNGLELLDLTNDVSGPEMELIASSVANAGARIRFFRIAYGAAGNQGMGAPEVAAVLADLTRGTRLNVRYVPVDPQPRCLVRLAFLALQCCETAVPHGGEVQIDVTDGAWCVTARGARLNIDQTLWATLSAPERTANVTPAQVQFALLPVVAHDLGRSIGVKITADSVTLRF